MPKIEPVPEIEIKNTEIDIRTQITAAGSNVAKVVELLNQNYGDRLETPQTLNRQIRQGIIPAWKERRIAAVLGKSVVWESKKL